MLTEITMNDYSNLDARVKCLTISISNRQESLLGIVLSYELSFTSVEITSVR